MNPRPFLAVAIGILVVLTGACSKGEPVVIPVTITDTPPATTPTASDSAPPTTAAPTTGPTTTSPTPTPPPATTPRAVTTSPTPTASPTTAGEWAVPDPITADYGIRVVNELYRLEVPVSEEVDQRASEGDDFSDVDWLVEAYSRTRTPENASFAAGGVRSLGPEFMLEIAVDSPGPVVITEATLVESTPTCIVLDAVQDSSAAAKPADENIDLTAVELHIKLVRQATNPTGWAIANEGGKQPCDQ